MNSLTDKLSSADQVIYARLKSLCNICKGQCLQTHDDIVSGVPFHKPVLKVRDNGQVQVQYEMCDKKGWSE